jgi:hypothetical protein
LEASKEETKKLNVLRVEQCEDGWSIGKWDHKYVIWHENRGD